jgi:hypothetical protein
MVLRLGWRGWLALIWPVVLGAALFLIAVVVMLFLWKK